MEFTTKAYEVIVKDKSMWHSLFYTVELILIYTALAMVLTILVAFPLTMKRLKGRKFFTNHYFRHTAHSGGLSLCPALFRQGRDHGRSEGLI